MVCISVVAPVVHRTSGQDMNEVGRVTISVSADPVGLLAFLLITGQDIQ